MTVLLDPEPAAARNVVRQWDDNQLTVPDPDDVLPWELAIRHLADAPLFWHVTQRPDSFAHVRPVFAVETRGMLWSTSSATARKTALLEAQPRCSFAASTDGVDLVYEATAVPVTDPDLVAAVADAYHRKYSWPVTVTADGAFDAPFGAPAAGPPPYRVFGYQPVTVWAFGTDERYAARSTRWDFG